MGLSSHFPESLKKFLQHKKIETSSTTTVESNPSSAVATPSASPTKESARSPANSIYTRSNNSSVTNIIAPCPGYMRDPTRCGSHPDVVGFYNDPMGGKFTLNHGYDCTNTGA